MHKALLIVAALGLVFYSVGLAQAWIGNAILAGVLLALGALLYGAAFILFCCRFFQWLRVLKRQGIDLSGLNFFRKHRAPRPFQREAWLQAAMLLLIPLVAVPLSFLQTRLENDIALSLYLLWPLSLFLYALLSRDFNQLERAVSS